MDFMRAYRDCAMVGLAVSLAALHSGCSATAGNDSDNAPAGQDSGGGNAATASGDLVGIAPNCGSRNTRTTPTNVYLEFAITEASLEIDPPDSALGAVVFPSFACDASSGFSQDLIENYYAQMVMEIGPGGEWLSTCTLQDGGDEKIADCSAPSSATRFMIEQGCLTEAVTPDGYDADVVFDAWDSYYDDGDAGFFDVLCPEDQIPLWRYGDSLFPDPDGEYICLAVEITTACLDCTEEDGVWSHRTQVTSEFVALGDLDNTPISGYDAYCENELDPIDIRAGDRVTVTQTLAYEYRVTASPDVLGYDVRRLDPSDFEEIADAFDFNNIDFGTLDSGSLGLAAIDPSAFDSNKSDLNAYVDAIGSLIDEDE